MIPPRLYAAVASPCRAALIAVVPVLAVIALHPGFVTQDGPARLYNAHIVARSFVANSPFQRAFTVRWEPLPNWAGHLACMASVSTLASRLADRVVTAASLASFACALGWLRGRVTGGRNAFGAALLSGMLALNITWLFGFSSFLLGAALFPTTLGVWWKGRDAGFSWRRAGALASLTALGYFCHLVSLGLTAFGLVVLEAATPGPGRRGRRRATALGLLPLIPLGFLYVRLMNRGGGIEPRWQHLANPRSPGAWLAQLGWVDPISLASKNVLPFVDGASAWYGIGAPVIWLGTGLFLALVTSRVERERLGWWLLGLFLILGGMIAPDTLGASHGGYLPQRVVLLGLAAWVPVVSVGKRAALLLGVALALQTATVFDYALHCERTAGRLLQVAPSLGREQRVATLLCDIRSRFRANPLLHVDCALGIGTDHVIYSDYETLYYYFPVHFRSALPHPDPAAFETLALSEGPRRARLCDEILRESGAVIDVVLAWQVDGACRGVLEKYGFRAVYEDGPVTLWRRGVRVRSL